MSEFKNFEDTRIYHYFTCDSEIETSKRFTLYKSNFVFIRITAHNRQSNASTSSFFTVKEPGCRLEQHMKQLRKQLSGIENSTNLMKPPDG